MKSMIRLGIILMLFCTIAALGLALTNNVTAAKIAEQITAAEQDALAKALPAANEFVPLAADRVAQFSSRADFADVQGIWEAKSAGASLGYVVKAGPVGYGDRIITLIGIDNDGKITGLVIASAAGETPGLGAKVLGAAFQQQYTGKGGSGPITVVKGTPSGDSQVQAITAATISSSAVTKGANEALAVWKELMGK